MVIHRRIPWRATSVEDCRVDWDEENGNRIGRSPYHRSRVDAPRSVGPNNRQGPFRWKGEAGFPGPYVAQYLHSVRPLGNVELPYKRSNLEGSAVPDIAHRIRHAYRGQRSRVGDR